MKALRSAFTSALLVSMAACGRHDFPRTTSAMNTIPLKTECVGRLLVDLPAKAGVSWAQTFDWAEVTRMPGIATEEEFWKKVEDRKKELESLPHDTEPNRLGLYRRVNSRSAIILFRSDAIQDETYHMDRYLWLGDRGYYFKTGANSEQIKNQLDQYSQIFTKMFVRGDVSDRTGFCIDGANVVGDVGSITAGASVSIPKWKTMHLSFYSGEDSAASPSLDPDFGPFFELDRAQRHISEVVARHPEFTDDPIFPKQFVILRKQNRTLAGRNGEEAVWRKNQNNGAILYKFMWFNSDPSGTPKAPGITIEMSVGNSDHPEISPPPEQDLMALWDAVLNSVRQRPGS